MRATKALLSITLLSVPLAAQEAPPPPFKPFSAVELERYTALGKQFTRWFFAGKADSLLAAMDAESAEGMGGLEGIRQQMDMIAERAGTVLNVLDEKMTRRGGLPQFWYEANFSEFSQEPLVFRWVISEEGKLVGAGMGPKSRAKWDPETE